MKKLRQYKGYWKNLKRAKNDYSYVVSALRQAQLPEVFAAIPYQETRYDSTLQSVACANGIWQFMPETGYRMGLRIKNCRYKGSEKATFTPKKKAPPSPFTNAEYINKLPGGAYSCRISSCQVDERKSSERSTKAAIKLLTETWEDDDLSSSGSLVQMTIMAHNAGYNDKPYLKKVKRSNILPSYKMYRKKNPNDIDGILFYGNNIKCGKEVDPILKPGERCGGVLSNQTQHYAYKVVAQHITAVCFYAKNYSNDPSFSKWEKYLNEDRYCSMMDVPTLEELKK
jgi:hypothetical protein